jgi:hypothetical protein
MHPLRRNRVPVLRTDDELRAGLKIMVQSDGKHQWDDQSLYRDGGGPVVRKILEWADAAALIVRCGWKTVPPEKRIAMGFNGSEWAVNGWELLDAGLVDDNLQCAEPTAEELTMFTGLTNPTTADIAAGVMVQYDNDVRAITNGELRDRLVDAIEAWGIAALDPKTVWEGKVFRVDPRCLFKRAYELMAYGYSSVNPLGGVAGDVLMSAEGVQIKMNDVVGKGVN